MIKKVPTLFVLTAITLIFVSFKTHNANRIQAVDNKNCRIYDKQSYQILDTAAFYLYYRYGNKDKPKGEGLIKKAEYYFSRDAASPIELLTKDNLKATFRDNLPFHYAMDTEFRNDQELIAYDTYCGCYKLKYIYIRSFK
jgi:hypothetical protein